MKAEYGVQTDQQRMTIRVGKRLHCISNAVDGDRPDMMRV